jgi:hypothetical protein
VGQRAEEPAIAREAPGFQLQARCGCTVIEPSCFHIVHKSSSMHEAKKQKEEE